MSKNISFPRGSEWRKWDLQVHTPGTKKNDQYQVDTGDPWELFCEKIHNSDVQAFGICDYFSADNYFAFVKKYFELYPDSNKAFFPNIEVCTSDVVNNSHEEVNVHLIFNPEIQELQTKITEFLSKLKTNKTDGAGREVQCSELSTTKDYEEATTTRKNIKTAFEDTFGAKVEIEDYMLIITAANNDGLRTGTEEVNGQRRGVKRKAVITDELDKFSHGFLGKSSDVEYFSNIDRLEGEEKTLPKPVFASSDSHSFDDIDTYLGKEFVNEHGHVVKQITWIKADLNYEGLKQTIYEPISGERVFVGNLPPDRKLPDRVIRKITFENTNDFPKTILFNSNLCSIIGSRSSGKSALLAYLANAVDPVLARETKPKGPAANISWDDVTLDAKVEWGNNLTQQGKVVYIPQNYLNELSSKPEEITGMIKPVLFERYIAIKQTYEKLLVDVSQTYNKSIEGSVRNWFIKKRKIDSLKADIKEIGDKGAIGEIIKTYEGKIEELKKAASLSDDDVKNYKDLSQQVHSKKVRIEQIKQDLGKIDAFINTENESTPSVVDFTINISFEPSIESLPDELQQEIGKIEPNWTAAIEKDLKSTILATKQKLNQEYDTLVSEINKAIEDNKDLIERCKKNDQLQDLIEKLDKQKEKAEQINKTEGKIVEEKKLLDAIGTNLKTSIDGRASALAEFTSKVEELDQGESEITFGIEIDFNPADYDNLSNRFNKKETSQYIENSERLKVELLRENPSEFLETLYTKKQNVLKGQDSIECAVDALTFAEEIRFKATMEEDSIGGFKESSMTEGKQALFALTLLLNKESDTWPLLLDQPEDDLDSRSIYDQIVPYLKEQKKRRQIIMVSHNANLVVGADSEQVIVANQHGDDRKNTNNQKFDYLSGSLEFTQAKNSDEKIVLQSCGIREHACDILDGGKNAFESRKNKYNI